MRDQNILAVPFQMTIAFVLNFICLLLPYRLRTYYIRLIAFVFHLPFYVFGRLATYLFKKLGVDPAERKE